MLSHYFYHYFYALLIVLCNRKSYFKLELTGACSISFFSAESLLRNNNKNKGEALYSLF